MRLRQGKEELPSIICVGCEQRVLLWGGMEQCFASPEIQQQVRDLQEESAIELSNQSKERALLGEIISTAAKADQISREFNVSDHGIDLEQAKFKVRKLNPKEIQSSQTENKGDVLSLEPRAALRLSWADAFGLSEQRPLEVGGRFQDTDFIAAEAGQIYLGSTSSDHGTEGEVAQIRSSKLLIIRMNSEIMQCHAMSGAFGIWLPSVFGIQPPAGARLRRHAGHPHVGWRDPVDGR